MRYLVKRGIERDGKFRFEAGEIIIGRQIPKAPIKHWLAMGVLEEVEDDEDDDPDPED